MKKHIFFYLFLVLSYCSRAQNAKLVVQAGHSDLVERIDFHSSGHYFLTCSNDALVKLWDVRTGKLVQNLFVQFGGIYGAGFIEDQNLIAAASSESIFYWDMKTGEEVYRSEVGKSASYTFATSPKGDYAATGHGRSFKLWDVKKRAWTSINLPTDDTVIDGTYFSPDGQLFAVGDEINLYIYEVPTGKLLHKVPNKADAVSFSPDSKKIACTTDDGYYVVWSLAEKKEIMRVKTGESNINNIKSVSFARDNRLVVGIGSKEIVIFNIESNEVKRVLPNRPESYDLVACSPTDDIFITVDLQSNLEMRALPTGDLLYTFPNVAGAIEHLSLSSNHKVVVTKEFNKTVTEWNLLQARVDKVFSPYASSFCKISPDGTKYAIATGQPAFSTKVVISDALTNKTLNEFSTGTLWCQDLEFSANSKVLAASMYEKKVFLWNLETGKKLKSVKVDESDEDIALNPDGTAVASYYDDRLRWWDSKGKEIANQSAFGIYYDTEFSADGQFLGMGSSSGLRVFKLGDEWPKQYRSKVRKSKYAGGATSIAFDPLGRFVASGQFQGNVEAWMQSEPGESIKLMEGHTETVSDMSFTTDGRFLVSAGADGVVKLWNTENWELTATLVNFGEKDDFIIFTPDNYYKASKSATYGVAFKLGERAFSFEQFDLKYNRPDIVHKRLGYSSDELVEAYYAAYQKRLRKMGFTEEMISGDVNLPTVKLVTTNIPAITSDKLISFEIEAEDKLLTLDRINVYVNDVPIYGTKGMSLRAQNLQSVNKNIELELGYGSNKIQISVHNTAGIESFKETFEVQYNGTKPASNLYVVAIGVSDYADDDFDLTYAAKDAEDIASTFARAKNYQKTIPITIKDGAATREKIKSAKTQLMNSRVDDEVVLFVAGHGLVDDNLDYYFATADVDFYNPATRGLAYEDLEGLLDGIPARKKLMLIDACHSGEIDKDESQLIASSGSSGSVSSRGFKALEKKSKLGMDNSFDLMKELFADLRRGTGAMVISSASGVEFAFESDEWKNGVFTYAILEGINTGNCDANRDSEIHVSELKDYVFKRVEELTDGKQHPTSRRENLEHDFVVW